MLNLPTAFTQRMREMLGEQYAAFEKSLTAQPPVSVRYNPYKADGLPPGKPVEWSRYGLYLDSRPAFTLDPMLHAGVYYVQEASSMFIEHIVRQLADPDSGLKILDMCAAPGGKTTLLATLAGPEGVVIANEAVRQRVGTLTDNVIRWGTGNVIVTSNDPAKFEHLGQLFDVVLVDAPCSGEGMFRKNPESAGQWTSDTVNLCAQRQRRILEQAWKCLAPGGILIYSTCTFNREENEGTVEAFAQGKEFEQIEINLPEQWAVHVAESGEKRIPAFRFFPHLVQGEGFFCAVAAKPAGGSRRNRPPKGPSGITDASRQDTRILWQGVNQPEYMSFMNLGSYYAASYRPLRQMLDRIAGTLNVQHAGVTMGKIYHGELKPAHSLAMFNDVNREAYPSTELPLELALDYLRMGTLDAQRFVTGTNLVLFENYPIGWARRTEGRVNNLYPKNQRILNL